jgi:hypothetical protein
MLLREYAIVLFELDWHRWQIPNAYWLYFFGLDGKLIADSAVGNILFQTGKKQLFFVVIKFKIFTLSTTKPSAFIYFIFFCNFFISLPLVGRYPVLFSFTLSTTVSLVSGCRIPCYVKSFVCVKQIHHNFVAHYAAVL